MDRALKERIIGAIVLVAIAVLVVPVFLDGPPAQGEIRSDIVPLPGQDNGTEVRTQVLSRDRDTPVPDEPLRERQTPAPKPVAQAVVQQPEAEAVAPAQSEPEPEARSASPVAAAGSTTGMWAVQVGSFKNQDGAEKVAADLRKQGFAAFISQLPTSSGAMHRVRVGPQKDREAAEAMAQRLSSAGHTGQVVPHP
ncbi:MAG: SPOR domain-containing protein [Woeseiaceae bacterium]|nr:SPOR domain-containing protein [Woeseiaceae bacterium]